MFAYVGRNQNLRIERTQPSPYRGKSYELDDLVRESASSKARLGPYSMAMPRVLGGSKGGGRFLTGQVPPYEPVHARGLKFRVQAGRILIPWSGVEGL